MIEFSEAIEELIEEIENKEDEKITRTEQIVLDVYESSQLIEEDGLHSFWFCSLNCDRSIKAFDEIGAYEIVDLIQSSQWCQTSSEDRSSFGDTEENYLSQIEGELMPKFEDVSEMLEEFLEDA